MAAAGLPTSLAFAEGGLPNSYSQGARAMAALLEQAPGVEAVFAISDLSAVGALSECQRRGIAVPGRISLLGFGDFDIGQQLVPPLSTIATDFPGMGRAAGRMIVELVMQLRDGAGSAEVDRRLDIGFNLLERGTTRAAATSNRRARHA